MKQIAKQITALALLSAALAVQADCTYTYTLPCGSSSESSGSCGNGISWTLTVISFPDMNICSVFQLNEGSYGGKICVSDPPINCTTTTIEYDCDGNRHAFQSQGPSLPSRAGGDCLAP